MDYKRSYILGRSAERFRENKMLRRVRYIFSLGMIWLLEQLPYGFAIGIARVFGFLGWLLDPLHRRIAEIQMKNALGKGYSTGDSLRVFMRHGDILVDAIRFAYMDAEELSRRVTIEGRQFLDEALASNRGVMLITGHVGNWEILAHLPRLIGIEFCVMADRRKDPLMESIVDSIRSRSGATILPPKGKALMLIRELRKGRVIGILVDQRGKRGDKVFCDVFGMPAPTNPAPAFIAIKGDAIIVPVYAIKEKGKYRVCFENAIDARAFSRDREGIFDLSQAMQTWVESVVRRYPTHWFWLHSRWTRRSDMRKIIKTGQDFRTYIFTQNERVMHGSPMI